MWLYGMRCSLIVACLSAAVHTQSTKKVRPLVIDLSSGRIRGEYITPANQKKNEYTVFKGIPYARPPVGSLRFMPPVEPVDWHGTRNATIFLSACFQPTIEMKHRASQYSRMRTKTPNFISEDCLYLNVFAPYFTRNEDEPMNISTPFAVVVFVHPGGFQVGSGADFDQEPILEHFVERDIVFVTLNYRLGAFGFMATGENDLLKGNMGLKDIILALKWVQREIWVFGGDADRVTLMGHGSGAMAASILNISPAASDLFAHTILMSGTALSPGAIRSTAINATWHLEAQLDCRAANASTLYHCVKNVGAKEIIKAGHAFHDDYQEFVPIVDGDIIERPTPTPTNRRPHPADELARYRSKKPMLLGTVRDESALSLVILDAQTRNMTGLTKKVATEMVMSLMKDYAYFMNHKLVTEGCVYEYVTSRMNPQFDYWHLYQGIIDLYSHFWYTAPTSLLAAIQTSTSKAPVYLYSFDQQSANMQVRGDTPPGVFHATDLILLFDTKYSFVTSRGDRNWQPDHRVVEVFTQLLADFIKHGNPTPSYDKPTPEEESNKSFKWLPFNESHLNYLSITDNPTMHVGYNWRGHVFWNEYARQLERNDVGRLDFIATLSTDLADYQLATYILSCVSGFLLIVLAALGIYCTRKDPDEDDEF